MKSILITLSAVAILFASCSKKPEKALPSKDGVWNFTGNYKTVDTDPDFSYTFDIAYSGTLTFNKNGSFVSVTNELDGTKDTETGTWSATKTTITMTNFTSNDPVIFNVSDLKRNSETWEYSKTEGTEVQTINLKLTR